MLAAADEWSGYGGVGDYAKSNGNTFEVLTAGHKMRDNAWTADAIETGESYDCVIVGGGISGLAAALFFRRIAGPNASVLVIENHPIFGGEAKQNEFEVDGKRIVGHQGSAIYFQQYPHSFLERFYDSIGLHTPRLEYQKPAGAVADWKLSRTPYDSSGLGQGQYGFWFGAKFGQKDGMWLLDKGGKEFQNAPVDGAVQERTGALVFWRKRRKKRSGSGRKYDGDAASRALDAITLEEHYIQHYGMTREFCREYLSPVEGGGSGLGPDALSAYNDFAFEFLYPFDDKSGEPSVQMFPGGNTTIARLMAKTLIPDAIDGPPTVDGVTRGHVKFDALDVNGAKARLRLSSTAVSVQHDGDPAKASTLSITYARDGKVYRVKARSAVMAGGSWTTKHVCRDLGEPQRVAYAQFYRSPCMMANVAVRNWRFLHKMGISGCRWFEGVGNYVDVVRSSIVGDVEPTITPDSPIVLAVKVLYALSGAADRRPRPSRSRGNADDFVQGIRRADSRAIRSHVSRIGIRCEARHRWNRFESVGTCVLQSAAGILLWQGWQAGAARNVAECAVWPDRVCEHGFGGRDGSSIFDSGSAPGGRAVDGSGFGELEKRDGRIAVVRRDRAEPC